MLYRYKLELFNDKISSSLSLDACVGGICTGRIVVLNEAISPLPQCYSNGTITWRKLPGDYLPGHTFILDDMDIFPHSTQIQVYKMNGLIDATTVILITCCGNKNMYTF